MRRFRVAQLLLVAVMATACVSSSISSGAATKKKSTVKAKPAPTTRVPRRTAAPSVAGSEPGAFFALKPSRIALFDGSGSFPEIGFRVVKKGGSPLKALFEGCALLAEKVSEHAQGMMSRKNFGGYDAMIFHFAALNGDAFWMKTVPMDLSVAWLTESGEVLSTAEMKGEGECGSACVIYPPGGVYKTALEAPRNGLGRLGLGSAGNGAVLQYGGPCRVSPKR
jgi:uncharacterized membrane protein (UPF0127 family)